MEYLGNFEIDRLQYGVIRLSENELQISVPSLGTQRTVDHVAPRVIAKLDGSSIQLSGDIEFDSETEQAIKAEIIRLLRRP